MSRPVKTQEFKVGDRVNVRGLRSSSNARYMAGGKVVAVHEHPTWPKTYDVEAGVDGRGLVTLSGMTARSLKKAD